MQFDIRAEQVLSILLAMSIHKLNRKTEKKIVSEELSPKFTHLPIMN